MNKSLVFESKNIGKMVVKNRLIRSATYEGMASEEGGVTDNLLHLYRELAQGGVGLIITSFSYVQQSGRGYLNQIGINKDDLVPDLCKLPNIVHKYGDGCKIAIQLVHCGRQSRLIEDTIAPSAVFEPVLKKTPREMTSEEVKGTIDAFVEAVRRAKEAGFDAVQLHAAHGYLLGEFLSPHTNRRTDEYGGSFENRFRIIKEIYTRSVNKVGLDYPIMIKMNVDDFVERGINLNESKKIAERLSNIGFAAIETSGGIMEASTRSEEKLGRPIITASKRGINSKNEEAYYLPYAREIKKVIDIPLILVGGMRSIDVIEKILLEGSADFVSLSRPLIREPDLPKRWLNEIGSSTADCISCNACLSNVRTDKLRCMLLNNE
jgi:2,4-dienoyl-CoA reductase-like NADH-dependent reductase (Old Yellow Enzyme family)